MNPVSRRQFLTGCFTLAATTSLAGMSGCSAFSREDKGLRELAVQARADAAAHPEIADLRRRHADLLIAENNRRCGIHPDGSTLKQCATSPIDDAEIQASTANVAGDVPQAVLDAARGVYNAVESIADESWLVLGTIYVELAQWMDTQASRFPLISETFITSARAELAQLPLPDRGTNDGKATGLPSPNSDDREALTDILSAEHAYIYYLGIAEAFSNSAQATALRANADSHRIDADALQAILSQKSSIPDATPLNFTDSESISDSGSAAQWGANIERDSRALWEALIQKAHHADIAQWALRGSAAAALRLGKLVELGVA